MQKGSSSTWFHSPNVGWRWAVAVCILWTVPLLAFQSSEAGWYLNSRVAKPLDFYVRNTLFQRGPAVSNKLKIYAIDDSSFAKLNASTLTLSQWGQVFKTLAKSQPRAIFVDSMFSLGDDPGNEFAKAMADVRAMGVPVNVGGFFTPTPVMWREPLDLASPDYKLNSMLATPAGLNAREMPPMVDNSSWFAYGPAMNIRPLFSHIGHFIYARFGSVAPLVKMRDDSVFAHLTLFLAKDRRIENGKLVLDGTVVPVDKDGYLNINFPSPSSFFPITKTMRSLLSLAAKGGTSEVVQKDDVVLLLPLMFTGNTDFTETPVGKIPGGYIMATMLNSVLTGQWLKPLAGGEALTVAGVLIGTTLGLNLGVIAFWLSMAAAVLGCFAFSQYLFAFQGIVVPWLLPVVGLAGAATTVFAEKTRVGEKRIAALRQTLEGSVAPGELKSLLKHPEMISFEARERVVTLMFIDVVGFSLLAENMLPRIAFDNLKKMLATLGEAVHNYGGIIDKTLGDGLLCYFGYLFDSDSSSPDHAEKALQCAIEIQRLNLRRNLEASENGDPVYPLRIGINTASCYLGDLGSQNRIDFTVVGNGVNFAKRLEGACDMHSVLIGATTNDLVKGIGLPPEAISKRLIRIKHHSELVEAYEYDPFYTEPELRLAAVEGFRKCANIDRVDQRWPLHDPTKIQLNCEFGAGQLVNFSHTGFSVKLPQLLARGTRLGMRLDGGGGGLAPMLAKIDLEAIQGEVRWGYGEGSEFVHGVLLSNITTEQSDLLVQYLCEFAFSRDAAASVQTDEKKAS